jgi:hypothetical protein
MSNEIVSSADNEYLFLKNNALLGFSLGVWFTSDVIGQVLSSFIGNNRWVDVSLMGVGIVVTLLFVVQLVKTINTMGGLSKAAFWYNDFQDEYINYINLKGYKWAFNIGLGVLFVFHIFDDHTNVTFNSISISDFSLFIVGVVSIAYSLPVAYWLCKESDDE